jgi:hypothetical protein
MIAPLYPPMLLERGIGERICGIIIGIFAIMNIILTPFAANIVVIFGKKRIYMLSLYIQVLLINLNRYYVCLLMQ